ncbi:Unknown protein, partial [Striga hermonthica]
KDSSTIGCRLPNFNRYETIETIRNMLTESQLKILKKSCFGMFFQLPFGIVQSQLVHLLLLRQVFQKNSEELLVDMCGKIMRFGIGEFSVLTGLKCVGVASKLLYQCPEDGLFNKFFASGGRLTREAIRLKFLSRCWSNDSDVVKLAILYFLANYLMGNELTVGFDLNYVAIIYSEDCNDYPWGKEIFEYFISHIVGKIFETKTSVYNKCRGLIVVLQWWFYEICKKASGLICLKDDSLISTIPRMLKWKADNSFDREFLVRKFFSLHHDQFSNIVPTMEEIERLHLDNLFNNNNEFIRHEDVRHNGSFAPSTSNNFDEQIHNLVSGQLQLQADFNSLKLLVHNFSAKVFEEFKVVHSTLK